MLTTIEFLRSSLHLVRMLRSQARPSLASIRNVYCASPIMPKRAAPASSSSSAPAATASNPLSIDYARNPTAYRILRGEMNVFKTNPYSAELKPLWRFKDEAAARKSSEALWDRFVEYRWVAGQLSKMHRFTATDCIYDLPLCSDKSDFVG